jgi:cytochrome c-type biogenesis protein CcmE
MELNTVPQRGGRIKFIIGGLLILAAVIYLIVSSTQANAQYFVTVEELMANKEANMQRQLRVSGAVLGDTIVYDASNLYLTFTVANVPGDNKDIETEGGLAVALHNAVSDPSRARMQVVVQNQPKPDLLRHEAQAIMTGRLGEDGIFYAEELLLKCPTKYEEAVPEQSGN